jgi:hypothetical protein
MNRTETAAFTANSVAEANRFASEVAEGAEAEQVAEALAMLNGTDRSRSFPRLVADQPFTERGTRAR